VLSQQRIVIIGQHTLTTLVSVMQLEPNPYTLFVRLEATFEIPEKYILSEFFLL
jgi:hypothetical protein